MINLVNEQQSGEAVRTGYAPRKKVRAGPLIVVALIHAIVGYGLVKAFAPGLTAAVEREVLSPFTVTITTPEPEPTPPPAPEPVPDEGAAAPPGKKATPREVVAPKPNIPLKRDKPAPKTSSTGTANNSGAADAGTGTGAGGTGDGTGSGNSGNGQGNGYQKLQKTAGDINSARDYPKKTRKLRLGKSVTILLTVGTDGRVSNCRVTTPSPDSEADAITCQLAQERFRFKPATNGRGEAVVGKYAWQQRWFTP